MFKSRIWIVIVVCLSLFFFVERADASVLLDRVVAVVNQEIITWSELYQTMEADASPKLKELQGEERKKIFRENEALFLESLINMKLQLQEARRAGIGVSNEEIRDAVDQIKKKYSMTEAAFVESLKSEGYAYEEYKKRLREQIIVSKLVNMQINSKIIITDEDLKKYVAENREVIEDTDGYRLSLILLQKKKSIENSTLEERAAEVIRRLKNGESFSELAKQFSDAPSAAAGGDLGFLKKTHLNTNFLEIISGLQPGDYSRPFWSDGSLHILRLDSISEAKKGDQMLEEARVRLQNKLFKERHNAWIKSLREKSFIEVRL